MWDLLAWLQAYDHAFQSAGVYAIASLALYFSLRAGLFNLSAVGIMSISAYAAGILTVRADLPWPLALAAAVVVSTVAGALVAGPVLRLRGHFLAIATLAFAVVVQSIGTKASDLTGGPSGLLGISADVGLPAVVALLAAILYVAIAERRSRLGRAWDAIRLDEAVAASVGVDVVRYKLGAFLVSTVAAGVAGALYAFVNFVLVPTLFDFGLLTNLLVYVLLGGIGNPVGPVVAAVVISTLPQWLRVAGQSANIFVGLLLLIIATYAPGGLYQLIADGLRSLRRGRSTGGSRRVGPGTRAVASATQERRKIALGQLFPSSAVSEPFGLEVKDLSKAFGGLKSLDSVSLGIRPGEVVALIGPNGAGKTTLINCITGSIPADSGVVELGGERIERWPPHLISARAGIRRTFQSPRVLPGLTVRENVLLGEHTRIEGALAAAVFKLRGPRRSEEAAAERARIAIEIVGLAEMGGDTASELPHGCQRLVEVARALVATPKVLLLDEPAAGLSEAEAADLKELLLLLAAQRVCSILVVDHNMPFIMGMAHRVVVVNFGQVIAAGTPDEVQRDERVIEAYFGHSRKAEVTA